VIKNMADAIKNKTLFLETMPQINNTKMMVVG
jgi:hypothetical protein